MSKFMYLIGSLKPFAMFIRKKIRLGYDSLGGKYKGEGKTAVDSPPTLQA